MKVINSESLFIDCISYSGSSLRVFFKSGTVYECENIDGDTIQEFLAAESHGKFFNTKLKPNYEFKAMQIKWVSLGMSVDEIKPGDRVETCSELSLVRRMKLPDLG